MKLTRVIFKSALLSVGAFAFFVISGNAQSFLSYQASVDDIESISGDISDATDDVKVSLETAPGIVSKSPALDPTGDTEGYEAFERDTTPSVSTEGLFSDSSQGSMSSRYPPIPIRYGLNHASLNMIARMISREKYRQSLAILEGIEDIQEEDSAQPEDLFELREQKLFLIISAKFHLGDYPGVVESARQYLSQYGNGINFYQTYYYFAASQSKLGEPIDYTFLVTDEFFEELGARESLNLRRFIIEDAIQKNQLLVALDYVIDANLELIPGFEEWVDVIIDKMDNILDIESLLFEYDNELIQSRANLRKIQLMIRDGQYESAREFIDRMFIDQTISSETLEEVQQLRDYVNIALNVNYRKIGVILPFSHKHPLFRKLAEQVSDGLELALQDYASADDPIQIIFKDSARDFSSSNTAEANIAVSIEDRTELVKRRVRELVEDDQVIAILGPLAKDTSLAAGEIAETYKVPVISFSQTENLGTDLPFLFRFQRNQIQEAKFLANYATDYLQAERFVLFYIENRSGKGYEIMRAFADTVKEKGGKIVGVTRVDSKKVDFKQNYLAMTGGLLPLTEEDEEELKKSGEKLTPIVDFDAMFVPTKINQLGIIMDFNRSFNAEKVWVLSGSDINVQENQLLSRTSRLRFVDAFPISSVRTYLQPFFEAHWKAFNFRSDYRPPTDYTIYAYEALEVLAKLLNDPKLHNRESLRNAIDELTDFPILTGQVSVSDNGEFEKRMNILRIRGNTTVPVF